MRTCLKFLRLRHAMILLSFILFIMATGSAWAVDVTLAWDPTTSSVLAGYKVYYRTCPAGEGCTGIGEANALGTLAVPLSEMADRDAPRYIVRGLPTESDFVFVVTAYTSDGMESGFSNEVYYSAPSSGNDSGSSVVDIQPPSIPTALNGVPHTEAGGVSLSWGASADDGAGLEGYRIYRDGRLISDAASTTYLDTDIIAEVTYSYGVTAFDSVGNESSMSDPIRITLNNSVVNDSAVGETTVIDNLDGSFTAGGYWGTSSFTKGYYGSNYRYTPAGNGSREAYWSFPVEEGKYNLAARWTAFQNRASNARYRVFNNGAEIGYQIFDQRFNGGVFNLFDKTYTVNTGTMDVLLTDAANGYIIADAVEIEYLGTDGDTPLPDLSNSPSDDANFDPIVIDNRDSRFSSQGNWGISAFTPGYYASDYRYTAAGEGEQSAVWDFSVEAGEYALSVRWSAYENRATNATYQIVNNGVTVGSKSFNQQVGGGVFHTFGTFTVKRGTLSIILNNNANGYVIADAIKAQRLAVPGD